jgi:hypothetical protein
MGVHGEQAMARQKSVSKSVSRAKAKEPLSVTHPELAAEWHPTKHKELLTRLSRNACTFCILLRL